MQNDLKQSFITGARIISYIQIYRNVKHALFMLFINVIYNYCGDGVQRELYKKSWYQFQQTCSKYFMSRANYFSSILRKKSVILYAKKDTCINAPLIKFNKNILIKVNILKEGGIDSCFYIIDFVCREHLIKIKQLQHTQIPSIFYRQQGFGSILATVVFRGYLQGNLPIGRVGSCIGRFTGAVSVLFRLVNFLIPIGVFFFRQREFVYP